MLRAKAQYARAGAIGSSQSAFGALHYSDCVDAVLAISPLDSFVQKRNLSSESTWLPAPGMARPHGETCHVTIHVADDNFLDVQYVQFCEAAHHDDPGRWTLRVVRHPGAGHPAYPGDAAVHEWLHGLTA